jgi:hypothetical protein
MDYFFEILEEWLCIVLRIVLMKMFIKVN